MRKGSGSRYRSSPRMGVNPTPSSSSGHGRAGEDLDAVSERNEFARQVSGVDPLPPAARVAPVDQERHAHLPGCAGAAGTWGGRVRARLRAQDAFVSAMVWASERGTGQLS